MDVQLFFRALWKRWWALLSSAILTILGLYALATNKTGSWVVWVSFAAAVAMLLVASALAWNDEHKRTVVLEGEVGKLRSVPAQLTITPYEIRTIGSMGDEFFLRAQIELLAPIELEVEGHSMELSFGGLIEVPEVRNDAHRFRLSYGTPSTPRGQPMAPFPVSLRSGHPVEVWIHFLTPRSQYELESSRMTVFVHTPRGDGYAQFHPARNYWLSSGQNFIVPDTEGE